MRKADFWNERNGAVRCELCPHNCLIAEGQNGYCGARGNRNGILYALAFGRIASSAFDPVEKKPLYHFYPGHKTCSIGSVGCNLRCRHCQNWQISCCDVDSSIEGLQEVSPEAVVRLACENDCQSLVWTYNEPSIWYEYILETAPLAQKYGLKTVLVTAGMLNSKPLQTLLPYIDAYRLDIKGFSAEFYPWLTGIDCLDQILENGLTAYNCGCHVEIVTNLIPGHNDDDVQMRGLARWIANKLSPQTPWHLTAYHPNHKLQLPATSVDSLNRGLKIGQEEGLSHVYVGNVSGHRAQDSHCASCGSCLIRRSGFNILENRLVAGRCPECSAEFMMFKG